MDNEKLLKRKKELFLPIDQQIMMTDEINDLLLLASNMCESSARIFLNQYGPTLTKALMEEIIQITLDNQSTNDLPSRNARKRD